MFKFGLRNFCRDFGIPVGTVERWLGAVLPLSRTLDGGILIMSAREMVALSVILPLVARRRGRRRQDTVRLLWSRIMQGLDLAERRGERAILVLDPTYVGGFRGTLLTASPDNPTPESPSHTIVPISDLERRWAAAMFRVKTGAELLAAAKAEGLVPA